MVMASENVQDIIVVFDESGSMASMGKEPLEAMNTFVDEQKECADEDARFSLYMFNTHVRLAIDDVKLK